jgi:ribonuclease Z
MSLSLTILGTGSPIPSPDRAGSASLLRTTTAAVLVDAGRGVVMRLAAAGVLPTKLDAVFITHLHSDHISDLNDVITTHWVMSPTPRPLRIIGPDGTAEMVEGALAMLAPDIRYRIAHHDDLNEPPNPEVTELQGGERIEIGDMVITAEQTDHRPVEPTLGYRVAAGDAIIALAGDSVPCAGLDRLCDQADLYVQTVIRDDLVRMIPSARLQDILDYHSNVAQAADTAMRNGVKTLVCTHYVPGRAPGDEEEWLAPMRQIFDGAIVLADDLTTLTAP